MNTADLVKNIRVASPCPARWADMTGDARSRFCSQCQKHVFNLSGMTAEAVATLLREQGGDLCGRFYQRADGTMLTADCPVGAVQVWRRVKRLGAAAVALLFASLAVSVWASEPNQRRARGSRPKVYEAWDDALVAAKDWVKPKPVAPPRGPVLLGKICITPPAKTPPAKPALPPVKS